MKRIYVTFGDDMPVINDEDDAIRNLGIFLILLSSLIFAAVLAWLFISRYMIREQVQADVELYSGRSSLRVVPITTDRINGVKTDDNGLNSLNVTQESGRQRTARPYYMQPTVSDAYLQWGE